MSQKILGEGMNERRCCQEVALTCIWQGGKTPSICIAGSWQVPKAQPWIPPGKPGASRCDSGGGSEVAMWNWELQRGPSQNVQCSVTRYPFTTTPAAGEQHTDSPGLPWLMALWGSLECIPASLTHWSLEICKGKLIWEAKPPPAAPKQAPWSRCGSVHLDTSPWPWLKPVGAWGSECYILIIRAAVEPGFLRLSLSGSLQHAKNLSHSLFSTILYAV